MEEQFGGKNDVSSFYRISSLRPPKIPVTLNRTALIQNVASHNNDATSLLKALRSSERTVSDPASVTRQKMKKELVKAHRSLETLCDRLWFKQNELYRQLCRYQQIRRETVRRLYQHQQEQLRNERLNKKSVASYYQVTQLDPDPEPEPDPDPDPTQAQHVTFAGAENTEAEAEAETEAETEAESCTVSQALQSMHLETILPPKATERVLKRVSLPELPTLASSQLPPTPRMVRAHTLAGKPSELDEYLGLPPINESVHEEEAAGRPRTSTSSMRLETEVETVTVVASEAAAAVAPVNDWLTDKQRKSSDYERKVLDEPFTVYRMDRNGEFVPRESKPPAFNAQMPSNKHKYRRHRLLQREQRNYQECLRNGESFQPVLHSIELKHLRKSADNAEFRKRGSNFEFISWVPM